MNKKIGIILVILAVIILVVVVNSSRIGNNKSTSTIKIGALLSLSGGASAWGENAKNGISLAVDEINNEGGINGKRVEVVYEDTASDPKTAVSAFQKVTSLDNVEAIIGPLNQTEVASVISIIDKTNIPTIVPGFLPLRDRKNINNPLFVWTDAETEAGRLAQYVYDQGVRKVAIIGTLDAWEETVTDSFAVKFTSLGGTVTDLEKVQPTANDMKLSVAKILANKPEAIYLGTYYQFVNSLKEISNQGYKGKLLSIEVDDYLAGETSTWSNDLQFIAPDYYSSNFVDIYKNKFGMAPGIPVGQSYDAMKILSLLLKEKRNDTLIAMKDFKKYNGVSGELTITEDGRTNLPTALFQVNNGKISRIKELR
jgi:branched-chain amino acid transport system substrate-binding protein